jgi:MFS family permease
MTAARPMLRLYVINVQLALNEGAVFAILPLQARAAGMTGSELALVLITFTVITLLSAPLWGWVGDRYGRKMPLQAALVLNAAGMLMLAFADSTLAMALSRGLGGMATGAGVSTRAYAADISTLDQRARKITLVDSAWAIGLSIGPLSAGLLAQEMLFSSSALFGAMSLLTLVFIARRLPEPQRAAEPAPRAEAPGGGTARGRLAWILGALLALAIGIACFRQAFVLHLAERFAYRSLEVGVLIAALGVVLAVTQIVIVPRIEHRIGSERLIIVSLVMFTSGMVWLPAAQTQASMACALVLEGVGGMVSSSLAGVMVSRIAAPRVQGRALGLVQSVIGVGFITGFFVAGLAYDGVAHTMPFRIGAALGCIALVLATYTAVARRRDRPRG